MSGSREKKQPINTAMKLARLLRSEGFTDHLANECDRYMHSVRVLSTRQLRKQATIEEAMRKITDALGTGDRMILGRFVALHKGLAFEAGLRTGLGVRVQQMGEVLTPQEVERTLLPRMGKSSARYLATYHALTTGQELPETAGASLLRPVRPLTAEEVAFGEQCIAEAIASGEVPAPAPVQSDTSGTEETP